MNTDWTVPVFLIVILGGGYVGRIVADLSWFQRLLILVPMLVIGGVVAVIAWYVCSKSQRERREALKRIRELPQSLSLSSIQSVRLGHEEDLQIPIYLPDSVRAKHVHILGATGSGKTESVILNFIKQDVARGLGSIILDAKGDASFMEALSTWVPKERLRIFDLGSERSLTYSPLESGSPIESAQRLFAALTWSEEYYKSKANSALQKLFEYHFQRNGKNPTLQVLAAYLDDPESLGAVLFPEGKQGKKFSEKEFIDLSGLRDQIRALCTAHLARILSPEGQSQMVLEDAAQGSVLYFRLQSLLSPQLVSTIGKLLINHINFLAGTAHRESRAAKRSGLIPTYLDEFASFACPTFIELISKARSAGYALHFSHQSIGDLADIKEGFLNSITDNSSTKIVLRINDPDSAEFFARSFGTELYQKMTQRVTNVKEIDSAEVVGEGTQREAHRFRAAPDLFKTLPTGMGAVLIAHGEDTPHGGSSVFKIRFPRLEKLPVDGSAAGSLFVRGANGV